ncbi:MAG: 1-(5-phosphoribosyl)-5-[(5-phosphoribosylamino)methylideneamino]imidazole-4-carboxamide isomerase [Candidatus Aureabacteria bacterium]|nr:1-(5-phosphoribosyl)-5-[(5-phosphoribosylamino)methylideneamino]imidazole-4-carboxamide isomerase [Candidatus Auribacterota bacterium]
MIVIPAVDIRNGKCVRLYQGRKEREIIYGDDPAQMALRWQREGAQYLHVVDLDGAFEGEPQNLNSLKEILGKVTIPIEFGGGLRKMEFVEQVFKWGVDRVVIGTAAVRDRNFIRESVASFGRRIFLGLDMRNGLLAVEGWMEQSDISMERMLVDVQEIGVGGVICTDISSDGTLAGPNFAMLEKVLSSCQLRVIASGGVKTVEHLRQLRALRGGALYGVIVGRALYSGDLKLEDALKALAEGEGAGREC